LANLKKAMKGDAPECDQFQQVNSDFKSLISDIYKGKENSNAGVLSFPHVAYKRFCKDNKKEKDNKKRKVAGTVWSNQNDHSNSSHQPH
jgi:hypothetical protein